MLPKNVYVMCFRLYGNLKRKTFTSSTFSVGVRSYTHSCNCRSQFFICYRLEKYQKPTDNGRDHIEHGTIKMLLLNDLSFASKTILWNEFYVRSWYCQKSVSFFEELSFYISMVPRLAKLYCMDDLFFKQNDVKNVSASNIDSIRIVDSISEYLWVTSWPKVGRSLGFHRIFTLIW